MPIRRWVYKRGDRARRGSSEKRDRKRSHDDAAMSQLFRKEALERRSRALFGDVVLRGPLSLWIIAVLVLITLGLMGWILFGIEVDAQTVWSWLT